MRVCGLAGFLIACGGCSLALAAADPSAPEWMAGYWLSCEGGRQTAEVWINGGGSDLLVGVNLNGAPPKQAFEFMRMAKVDGKLAFIASPDAAPQTAFPLKTMEGTRAVFENLTHDFPQRVIYERDGDLLKARIEGVSKSGEQGMDWTFHSARLGENCAK
jgi:hypothetical protein